MYAGAESSVGRRSLTMGAFAMGGREENCGTGASISKIEIEVGGGEYISI